MDNHITKIRKDFPILQQSVHNKPLVYLDNAASTQKPKAVIDAISDYYQTTHANIHRSAHALGDEATLRYETARDKVAKFINAKSSAECIFTKGATEAINLVANCFRDFISAGDEILISHMEHHSNIVPWQLLCERTNAKLTIIPMQHDGSLQTNNLAQLITAKTKLIAVMHASNSLGTINPIKEIITLAHKQDIPVLIDGAQAGAHLAIDVQDLDCDFYALSGHKMYGPTGIGVLYGKKQWLGKFAPYQGGGDMILQVTFDQTTYNKLPFKFEAGTPPIASAIGLGAAIDYLTEIGQSAINQHETALLEYATNKLTAISELSIVGNAAHKIGVISFTVAGIHPHDLGTACDTQGVAIRCGHHCNMPVMQFYQIPATARMSFAMYTSMQEIDVACTALTTAINFFKGSNGTK